MGSEKRNKTTRTAIATTSHKRACKRNTSAISSSGATRTAMVARRKKSPVAAETVSSPIRTAPAENQRPDAQREETRSSLTSSISRPVSSSTSRPASSSLPRSTRTAIAAKRRRSNRRQAGAATSTRTALSLRPSKSSST
jgi:hypothetical protein